MLSRTHIFSFIRSNFLLFCWSWCCCCFCCYYYYIHSLPFWKIAYLETNKHLHTHTNTHAQPKRISNAYIFEVFCCVCVCLCDSATGNIVLHRVFVHMYQCICQSHLGTESVVIDQHVNRILEHGTWAKRNKCEMQIAYIWERENIVIFRDEQSERCSICVYIPRMVISVNVLSPVFELRIEVKSWAQLNWT